MPEKIYCLKCKTQTDTKNITSTISKNGQSQLKGNCVQCNSKKCKFVKK